MNRPAEIITTEEAFGLGAVGSASEDKDIISTEEAFGTQRKPSKPDDTPGQYTFGEAVGDAGVDLASKMVGGMMRLPLGMESWGRGIARNAIDATARAATSMPGMGLVLEPEEIDAASAALKDKTTRGRLMDKAMDQVPRVDAFERWNSKAKEVESAIASRISEEGQAVVDGSVATGNIFKGELSLGDDPTINGYIVQIGGVIGSMIPTIAAALVTKRLGGSASTAAAAGAAVGGGMAAGEAANVAREHFGRLTHEQMLEVSPNYGGLLEQGVAPEQARKAIIERAGDAGAMMQGFVAAVGDKFTGDLLLGRFNSLIGKTPTRVGRAGTGAMIGGTGEAVQEVTEGVASDLAIRAQDTTKEIGEHSAASAVLGFAGGGIMGGGRGFLTDRTPAPPPPPDQTVNPEAGPGSLGMGTGPAPRPPSGPPAPTPGQTLTDAARTSQVPPVGDGTGLSTPPASVRSRVTEAQKELLASEAQELAMRRMELQALAEANQGVVIPQHVAEFEQNTTRLAEIERLLTDPAEEAKAQAEAEKAAQKAQSQQTAGQGGTDVSAGMGYGLGGRVEVGGAPLLGQPPGLGFPSGMVGAADLPATNPGQSGAPGGALDPSRGEGGTDAALSAPSPRTEPPQNRVDGMGIAELPVDALKLSEDVPQFKSGADEAGVVEPLGGTFDRRGVAPIQVWERNDGSLEVISGRHRLDLARRSGEATIPAQVHREADGFSTEQARALDAELNIRDNQGKAIDYVDYFKNQGISREQAAEEGLVARNPGRRAFEIAASGSEETVAALRAGRINEADAERLVTTAPGDQAIQAIGLEQLQSGKSGPAATAVMQAAQAIRAERGITAPQQGTMFEEWDDSGLEEAERMGRVAARKKREAGERLSAIRGANNKPEIAAEYGIDIKDKQALEAKVAELRMRAKAWENWPTNPELMAEVRSELTGAPKRPDAKPQQQLDAILDGFADERADLAKARADADGRVRGLAREGSLERTLQAATSPLWDTSEAAEAIISAVRLGRADIAQAIIARAQRNARLAANAKPGVDKSSPKYPEIKKALEMRADEARKDAEQLERLYGLRQEEENTANAQSAPPPTQAPSTNAPAGDAGAAAGAVGAQEADAGAESKAPSLPKVLDRDAAQSAGIATSQIETTELKLAFADFAESMAGQPAKTVRAALVKHQAGASLAANELAQIAASIERNGQAVAAYARNNAAPKKELSAQEQLSRKKNALASRIKNYEDQLKQAEEKLARTPLFTRQGDAPHKKATSNVEHAQKILADAKAELAALEGQTEQSAEPAAQGKPDTPTQIRAAFDAIGAGAKVGALRYVGDKIERGEPVVYSKEATKEAARNDPDYNTRDLPDGTLEVIGAKHPDKGWVGQAPETQQPLSAINPTTDKLKSDGTPFKTDTAAKRAAKARNITGSHTPVAVEGGWVLRRNEVEGQQPKLDLDAELDAAGERIEARKQFAKDNDGKPFSGKTRRGDARIMVTPSPKEPGKWQVTRVDADGPSGDTQASSYESAVDAANQYGIDWGSAQVEEGAQAADADAPLTLESAEELLSSLTAQQDANRQRFLDRGQLPVEDARLNQRIRKVTATIKQLFDESTKESAPAQDPNTLPGIEPQNETQQAIADRQREKAKTPDNAPSPEGFTLTGSTRPADEAAAAGQQDLLGGGEPQAAPAQQEKPAGYGKSNKVFTEDAAAKAREVLRKKLGQVSSGLDPEMVQAGITLAGYHIEAGARSFADYSKAMISDLGDAVQPYLRSWYEGARYHPGFDAAQDMTPAAEIDSAPKAEAQADQQAEQAAPNTGRDAIVQDLIQGRAFKSITEARKRIAEVTGVAIQPGTQEAKQADEMIEQAGILAARQIVNDPAGPVDEQITFDALVALADQMPSLNVRTSTSVAQQAYSTPLPLAYVASRRAGVADAGMVLEPTAGNAALLLEAAPETASVNELNPERAAFVRELGFEVTEQDAAASLAAPDRSVDALVANPPFGVVQDADGNSTTFDMGWAQPGYKTNEVDHAIALRALSKLKDTGKAVLIIGGPNKTLGDAARSDAYNGKAKRGFFVTLYNQYNVTDHFTVSGDLYSKQGAAWPVDVIVIEGRGKSQRALPSVDLPRKINTIEELRNELPTLGAREGVATRDGQAGKAAPAGARPASNNAGTGGATARGRTGGGRADGRSDDVRPGREGEPDGARPERVPAADATTKRTGDAGGARQRTDTEQQRVENPYQAHYTPSSAGRSVGTLVPTNMQTAVKKSLAQIADKHGSVDQYVAKLLDYAVDEVPQRFSAEQVDALALALDNIESGKGFIIGDQTGVGKGRVNAGVIRYAMLNKQTPVFVTVKPNLYSDMLRDLADIGMPDVRPLVTNTGFAIPLDDDARQWYEDAEKANARGDKPPKKHGKFLSTSGAPVHNKLLRELAETGKLKDHDVVFTTYDQMQTVKGERTVRQDFLDRMSSGGVLILDESHNAGGTEAKQRGGKGKEDTGEAKGGRAGFVRAIARNAKGVFYSSATYAKRPDVMDLYFKTDMGLAAGSPKQLAEAMEAGGVPLQQVVATMLAESGQYIRREKSFDGIEYRTTTAAVDKPFAENASTVMRDIMRFDVLKKAAIKAIDKELKAEGKAMSMDGSTGGAGAQSTNFTSVMHNLLGQMLLTLKVQPAIDEALGALQRGEKPIIALSNTMGSAIQEYATDVGLKPGDAIALSFADLMKRYLQKSRRVIEGDAYGKKTIRELTDAELGPAATRHFKKTLEAIDTMGFDQVPISPIDAIHNALRQAGYKTGEITGRGDIIDYSSGQPIYRRRPAAETSAAGKLKAVNDYNSGSVDALIINQSGATGLSAHASEKFADQRRRFMIIAQPELNIDTHMQMLGRINRTGQITGSTGKAPAGKPGAFGLPAYAQLVADIPAEKRPASILSKKMAMLNANTTAARDSALKAKDTPDFMNEYGDQVAAAVMTENPQWHSALGEPLHLAQSGDGLDAQDAMRKVTGRIPVLSLANQEAVYAAIEDGYNDLIDTLSRMGENKLEAKSLDLDAKLVKSVEVVPRKVGTDSPFADGVRAQVMDVKRIGTPMKLDEVRALIEKNLDGSTPSDWKQRTLSELADRYHPYARDVEESYDLEDQKDAKRRTAEITRLEQQRDRAQSLIRNWAPGAPVTLTTPKGSEYVGYIGKIEHTKSAKNPVAPGAWKATIYIADAAKQLKVPLSRMTWGDVDADGRYRIGATDHETVRAAFEEGQSASRQDRTIIMGNLLSGYGTFGRGQIINFTDSEGAIQQGILMPQNFDLDKSLEKVPTLFDSVEQVVRFVGFEQPATLGTEDGNLTLTRHGGLQLVTPRSKAKGGRFFLNKKLIDALGRDFVTAGNSMQAKFDVDRLPAVVQAIYDMGAGPLVAKSHKAEAKAFLEQAAKEANPDTQAQQPTEPTGDIEATREAYDADRYKLVQQGMTYKEAAAELAKQGRTRPAQNVRTNLLQDIYSLDDGSDIRSSRAKRPQDAELPPGQNAPGIGTQETKQAVDKALANYPNAPSVTVLRNPGDPRLPQAVREKEQEARRSGAGASKGVYVNGTVYLFADDLAGVDDAVVTALHEINGHDGLRGAFGTALDSVLDQIVHARRKDVMAKAREYGLGKKVDEADQSPNAKRTYTREDLREAADELLSDMAQTNPQLGFVKRAVAAIRKVLQDMGVTMKLSDEDIIYRFILPARAYQEGKLGEAARERLQRANEGRGNLPALDQDIRSSRRTAPPPDNPTLAEAKRRAGLGPRETFVGKMQRITDTLFDAITNQRNEIIDAWRQGNLDQFHGIKRMEQRQFGNLPHEQSAYVAARLSTGTSAVMRALLMHGAPKWTGNMQHLEKIEGTKGLLDILSPLGNDLDNWLGWMAGNRAARLMDEGREHNFTAEHIRELRKLGHGKEQLFRQVANEYAAFKGSVLDVAETAGLIDPESRQSWDHADYIPFYRQMEEQGQTLAPRGKRGLGDQSSGIKRLRGGESILNDPLENIIMNFHHLIDASLKNNAARKAIEMGPEDMIKKLPQQFQQRAIPNSQIKKALLEQGVPVDIVASFPPTVFKGISKMWSFSAPTDKNVVRVMMDGKATYYRINDPLLLQALTSFQAFDFPGLGVARAFKRLLTASVTASPEFMLRNFIRDTASTAIISRDMTEAMGAIHGIAKALNNDGSAEHMMFAGASFASGFIDGGDPASMNRTMRRALRNKGMSAVDIDQFMGSMINSTQNLWGQYRRINEALENANREAVYEATMKRSGSTTSAAYEAKDLMDFSLRGSWAAYQVMADVIPFFNARVQGLYRLGRTDPKQLALRGGAMLVLPSILLAIANLGNDDYDELNEWDKDLYFHFYLGGEHFRIPKPFEVGLIFGTVPERMVRLIAGKDDGKKTLERIGWGITETLNLAGPITSGFGVQALRPLAEVASNKDAFRDRPIEHIGDESQFPHMRYSGGTSDFARELLSVTAPITDPIGLSPKKFEHLINGYFGTMGMWALAALDMGTRAATDTPVSPATRIDEVPLLKVLYRGSVEMAPKSTKYINDVYAASEQFRQMRGKIRAKEKERVDLAEMTAIREKYHDRMVILSPFENARKSLTKLSQMQKRVYSDRTLTAEQKREKVDEILARRAEVAKRASDESRARREALR